MEEQDITSNEQFAEVEKGVRKSTVFSKNHLTIFLFILLIFLIGIPSFLYHYKIQMVKKFSTPALSHDVSSYRDSFPKTIPLTTPTSAPADNNLFVFRDTLDATSLTIEIATESSQVSYFTFTTPNAQYTVDGDNFQSSSDGTLTLAYHGSAEKSTVTENPIKTPVPIAITARILPKTFEAEASFTDETTNQQYNVTTNTPDEENTVHEFNQAVLSEDWQTLFSLTSTDTTAGMTADQFATTMRQQVATIGTITDITITNISPVTRNPAGISTFTAEEEMTLRENGVSTKQGITTTFILDNGMWKVWFSR